MYLHSWHGQTICTIHGLYNSENVFYMVHWMQSFPKHIIHWETKRQMKDCLSTAIQLTTKPTCLATFLFRVLIVSGGVVLHWTPNLEIRSGFEPWPGSFCCVFGQETLLSQCLSPFRLGGGGQSTCDKNIIFPIMTLLLTNDLPLFQTLVSFYNFFLFFKRKRNYHL